MKECGGGGVTGYIPPQDYIPKSFDATDTCNLCEKHFYTNSYLRDHIRSNHTDYVKKCWSMEAFERVTLCEEYDTWLKTENNIETDRLMEERKELEKGNKILRERNQNLANSQDTFVKVSQKGNIFETRREIFTQNKDGKLKKSVLTEQFANITKRKNNDTENIDPKKQRPNQQSKGLSDILDHMSAGNEIMKTKILAGVIDAQGQNIATNVAKESKELKLASKLTKESTAAIIAGANMSDYQVKQLRTACNKELGSNPFASARQVTQARNEALIVDRKDWEITYHDLYRNKVCKNADKKRNVKHLKSYIEKVAVAEKNKLANLNDGDDLHVCWDGDGGGGRFVAEFTFLNNTDRKITLHPFLIFEGTDVRANLEVTLGRLTKQIKELEGASINIEGKNLKIKQFGVFDLCALNAILGKQNHSATFFDAWTDCTLDHIRNHSGRKHTTSTCKNIKFQSLEDLEKHLTNHSLNSIPQRKTGNKHGNVIGENLLPLDNMFRYIPPLMHIIMGLGNDVVNELKRIVRDLDDKESEVQTMHNNVDEKLQKLHEERETLETNHKNNALDKFIAEHDFQQQALIKKNKIKEAAEIAKKRYTKVKSRAQKQDCDTGLCVIFPCDEENGYADILTCKNGCKVHNRCEGIVYVPHNYVEPEIYTCKKCNFELQGDEWLEKELKEGIKMVTDENRDIMRRLTEIKIEIEKIENEELKCGERENKLKESMKIMKINPAIYHGGDFEGKAIQKMLDCARDKSFTILQCVSDQAELFEKFQRALTTLHEVSDLFKSKIEYFDDEEVEIVKTLCENWGKNWPIDFPNLNITPKGHDLVWVLPEVLRQLRSFYMFYKVEEKGESIHAELNSIQRKIWCIRDPAERLWKYIERYELKNTLETDLVLPYNRFNKK